MYSYSYSSSYPPGPRRPAARTLCPPPARGAPSSVSRLRVSAGPSSEEVTKHTLTEIDHYKTRKSSCLKIHRSQLFSSFRIFTILRHLRFTYTCFVYKVHLRHCSLSASLLMTELERCPAQAALLTGDGYPLRRR